MFQDFITYKVLGLTFRGLTKGHSSYWHKLSYRQFDSPDDGCGLGRQGELREAQQGEARHPRDGRQDGLRSWGGGGLEEACYPQLLWRRDGMSAGSDPA